MMDRRTVFSPQKYVPGRNGNEWLIYLKEGRDPPGLIVKNVNDYIGKGVFTSKKVPAGSFLMEYQGEVISEEEANIREKTYPDEYGSFLLYFKCGRTVMCIDATFSTQCGRYVNDGIAHERNSELKVVYIGKTPHVVLFATRNICKDEEIRYDYGVPNLPWRQKTHKVQLNTEYSIKECTVLLEKCDLSKALCYEKEDGSYGEGFSESQYDKPRAERLDNNKQTIIEASSDTLPEKIDGCVNADINKLSASDGHETEELSSVNSRCYGRKDGVLGKFFGENTQHGSKRNDDKTTEGLEALATAYTCSHSVSNNKQIVPAQSTKFRFKKCTVLLEKCDSSKPLCYEKEDGTYGEVFTESQYDKPRAERLDNNKQTITEASSDTLPEKIDGCVHADINKLGALDVNSRCYGRKDGALGKFFGENTQHGSERNDNKTTEGLDALATAYICSQSVSNNKQIVPALSTETLTKKKHACEDTDNSPLAKSLCQKKVDGTFDDSFLENIPHDEKPTTENLDISTTAHCQSVSNNKLIPEASLETLPDKTDGYFDADNSLFCESDALFVASRLYSDLEHSSYSDRKESTENENQNNYTWVAVSGGQCHDLDKAAQSLPEITRFPRMVDKEEQSLREQEEQMPDSELTVHCIIIEDGESVPMNDGSLQRQMAFEASTEKEETLAKRTDEGLVVETPERIAPDVRESLTVAEEKNLSNLRSRKKPHRPCPYCHCMKSALSKHMIKKHKNEVEVKHAISLPKQDRNRAFTLLKRKGIMAKNMSILQSKHSSTKELIRERKSSAAVCNQLTYCSKCFGFFAKQYFHKHRKTCHLNESSVYLPYPIQPDVSVSNKSSIEKFKTEVLDHFNNDDVGIICKTDSTIVAYGQRKFHKLLAKKDNEKYDDKKTTIRSEMRRIGHLYKEFNGICEKNKIPCLSSLDMFKREHFYFLEEAIEQVTINVDGSLKAGPRKDIGYLIKRVCKFLHGKFLVEENDKKVGQVDKFLNVLTFYWTDLFGEAESSLVINRETRLRKPMNLPKHKDVKTLRDYTLSKIKELTDNDYTFIASTEFKLLRSLVISRLTLFNARRGGEPSSLLIRHWKDAENDVWVGEQECRNDPTEQALLGKFKVAYQSGKGGKIVPLLILDDCWEALNKLSDAEIRKQAGIHPQNNYLFPLTQFSTNHANGWQAVQECCTLAGLRKNINATSMRHYVSTIYASLEVSETDRESFYAHMGHSGEINKNVYQCPPARQEVTRVGRFLYQIDQGSTPNDPSEIEQMSGNESGHCGGPIKTNEQGGIAEDGMGLEIERLDNEIQMEMEELENLSLEPKSKLKRRSKKRYMLWSKQNTDTVRSYFNACILSLENIDSNKGSLPSVVEMKAFLGKFPNILQHLPKRDRIVALRTKIFNERKLAREKVRRAVMRGNRGQTHQSVE